MARILIVNDEADLVDILSTVLQSRGHSVAACTSPPDALHLAEKGWPDLLLLDLVMLGMTGEEFLRRVRAMTPARRVPTIMMSASLDGALRAARAGADGFLPKPFESDDLVRSVDTALASARVEGGSARKAGPSREVPAARSR